MAVASRDVLPLVVRPGSLPGRDPPGRGGGPDSGRAGVHAPQGGGGRQDKLFVHGDGIDPRAREHAEGDYLRLLDWLQEMFSDRPFMLGERPTMADIGLMGPFWRHFVHDPTPARLIQEQKGARGLRVGGADSGRSRGARSGARP